MPLELWGVSVMRMNTGDWVTTLWVVWEQSPHHEHEQNKLDDFWILGGPVISQTLPLF